MLWNLRQRIQRGRKGKDERAGVTDTSPGRLVLVSVYLLSLLLDSNSSLEYVACLWSGEKGGGDGGIRG